MLRFDPNHPDYSLRFLVADFERNPKPPEDIPQSFLNYYGIAVLANSLTLVFPKLPEYDSNKVINILKNNNPKTLDGLINVISRFNNDMEKLFAIYYFGCHHIRYDTDAFFSGNIQHATLESVFSNR